MICRSSSNEVFSPGSIVKDANFGLLSPWALLSRWDHVLTFQRGAFFKWCWPKGNLLMWPLSAPFISLSKGFPGCWPVKVPHSFIEQRDNKHHLRKEKMNPSIILFSLRPIFNKRQIVLCSLDVIAKHWKGRNIYFPRRYISVLSNQQREFAAFKTIKH